MYEPKECICMNRRQLINVLCFLSSSTYCVFYVHQRIVFSIFLDTGSFVGTHLILSGMAARKSCYTVLASTSSGELGTGAQCWWIGSHQLGILLGQSPSILPGSSVPILKTNAGLVNTETSASHETYYKN